jgi:glycosyltransferase involved in cell wall biosynthesis
MTEMKKYICEINVPGYGPGCFRHIYTLQYHTLMLAYDNLKDIYILPNIILEDFVDCIYFNEDNIHEKIKYILNNSDKIREITLNGHEKFKKYYDYEKSARQLYDYLIT